MKLFNIIFLIGCFLLSCNTTKEREMDLREKELELKEKELNQRELENSETDISYPNTINKPDEQRPAPEPSKINNENPTTKTKYGFVAFLVKVPVLVHRDGSLGINGISSDIPEMNYVTWEEQVYTSTIVTIDNYNEDQKYKLLEDATSNFRLNKLFVLANDFKSDVMFKVNDASWKMDNQNIKATLENRKVIVFDSYKAASEAKSNGIRF